MVKSCSSPLTPCRQTKRGSLSNRFHDPHINDQRIFLRFRVVDGQTPTHQQIYELIHLRQADLQTNSNQVTTPRRSSQVAADSSTLCAALAAFAPPAARRAPLRRSADGAAESRAGATGEAVTGDVWRLRGMANPEKDVGNLKKGRRKSVTKWRQRIKHLFLNEDRLGGCGEHPTHPAPLGRRKWWSQRRPLQPSLRADPWPPGALWVRQVTRRGHRRTREGDRLVRLRWWGRLKRAGHDHMV